jgi:DnaJ family protein C protein 17
MERENVRFKTVSFYPFERSKFLFVSIKFVFQEMLKRIFSKFGDVLEVVVLPGKKKTGGSGLVEMSTRQSAVDAVNIERGFADNPLKLKMLDDGSSKKVPAESSSSRVQVAAESSAQKVAAESFQDFETLVMRQMRQQEERKRLIEQMMKEEDN